MTAIRPDGSVEPMLWVNSYRAEWPAPYILKEAIVAARGNAISDDGVLRQQDRRGARREAASLPITAPQPSRPTATPRTVNGTVDNTLLRWNCSQIR